MSFIPISPCCLRGATMNGTPRGELQKAGTDGVTVDRYFVRPKDGVVANPKTALLLFYDIFGFQLPNCKIVADEFSDRLKVDTFIPDYIPNAPPASFAENVIEEYPGQSAAWSWYQSITGRLRLIRVLPYLSGILDYSATPHVDKAVADVVAQGYETILAVGYCRGGSMITHLLAKGDVTPVTAAVIFHPDCEPARWPLIRRPTLWQMASVDNFFPPKKIVDLEKALSLTGMEHEVKLYENTCHGFGSRPVEAHAPTMKAFNEANEASVGFLKKFIPQSA